MEEASEGTTVSHELPPAKGRGYITFVVMLLVLCAVCLGAYLVYQNRSKVSPVLVHITCSTHTCSTHCTDCHADTGSTEGLSWWQCARQEV